MGEHWTDANRLYPRFVDAINVDEATTVCEVLEACMMILAPILSQMTPRETGAYYYDLKRVSEAYRHRLPDLDEPAGHA